MAVVKIGVTAGGRVEQFESEGWDLVRLWRFAYGYDAMEIEERVLDRWRNLLSMGAAVRSSEMPSGYSETARYSPATVTDVIAFVSRCHEELALAHDLGEGQPWDDQDGWAWPDEPDQHD